LRMAMGENRGMKRVLFLCTGNYYRSRFAEVVFNHLARAAGLAWEADSCGLRVQADGVVNAGPLSRHAFEGLAARGLAADWRRPRQVTEADLRGAARVVALKEAEHRGMMERLFPEWAARIEYWNVHDLDAARPVEALAELERLVRGMVDEMAGNDE
jgi:protein-tyrosine phosphatase